MPGSLSSIAVLPGELLMQSQEYCRTYGNEVRIGIAWTGISNCRISKDINQGGEMEYPEHKIAPEQARVVMDRLRGDDQRQRDQGLAVEERTRNVTAPTGLFLFSLVRTLQPSLIVEVGSSTAYSTIWMAIAADTYGGQIIGSEILPERAVEGNRNLVEAGYDHLAHIETGDGSEIASRQASLPFVFLDAEKDDYLRHFNSVVELVPPGGLILTDNVTSHDCSELLDAIRARTDVVTQTITFERGLEYTVKL
jgi:caffeoyl-CoA O-methyltransferase